MTKITIRKAAGTWTVRAGGAILAESRNALELTEGENAPVIYFPRADIAMAFLEESPRTSHCPFKGDARYFSIETKSQTIENAGWSYADRGAYRILQHRAGGRRTDLSTAARDQPCSSRDTAASARV